MSKKYTITVKDKVVLRTKYKWRVSWFLTKYTYEVRLIHTLVQFIEWCERKSIGATLSKMYDAGVAILLWSLLSPETVLQCFVFFGMLFGLYSLTPITMNTKKLTAEVEDESLS